jgi:hypothetical protein
MSVKGWLFPIGLLSVLILCVFLAKYLVRILNHYDSLSSKEIKTSILTVLLFPLIFLFQFEVSDQPDNYYIIEYYIGKINLRIKDIFFVIAIVTLILYLKNYFKLTKKVKEIKSTN